MAPLPRVVALGQPAAADDGVGPAVLEELRRRGADTTMELVHAADPMELLTLVEIAAPVVVVDAAVGGVVGDVRTLDVDDLPSVGGRSSSTHGIGAGGILRLARVTAPARVTPALAIVAVMIPEPAGAATDLSAPVAAAVPRAADAVEALVRAHQRASR